MKTHFRCSDRLCGAEDCANCYPQTETEDDTELDNEPDVEITL